ncbi:hypothetical protein [Pseudoalteromonas umbrosa]|nr:hypothetical protein [Pseudoalteromonas sp. B95]MDK1290286.1 hypothetical protein [Pseudoalteromonas sp. B95]
MLILKPISAATWDVIVPFDQILIEMQSRVLVEFSIWLMEHKSGEM